MLFLAASLKWSVNPDFSDGVTKVIKFGIRFGTNLPTIKRLVLSKEPTGLSTMNGNSFPPIVVKL